MRDSMLDRPRLRSTLHAEVIGPDRILLIEAAGEYELRGRLFIDLLPWMDGHHTIAEIAERLDERLTLLDVDHGIRLMAGQGLLADGNPPGERLESIPELGDARSPGAAPTPARGSVRVVACGLIPAGPLVERLGLASSGVLAHARGELVIVLVDDYLDQMFRDLLRTLSAGGTACLPVRPGGPRPWLGPLIQPPRTPCGACLAARIAANRGARTPLAAAPAAQDGTPGPGVALVFDRLAEIAHRWRAGESLADLEGCIRTLDTAARGEERHAIVRRSECPECGAPLPADRAPAPISLDGEVAAGLAGAGYRSIPPAATWRLIRHHVSPVSGIVSRLTPIGSAAGDDVHVYVTGQNVARVGRDSVRAMCAGKGLTASQARVGAVCEALERHCGVHRGDEPRVSATRRALGAQAIDPRDWLLFSEAQYAERDAWNLEQGAVNWVPRPFDADCDIEWTPVRSLRDDSVRYVPAQLCWYGHPESSRTGFGRADSSGSAAGNNAAEAIVQGFMELVERDAVALWWYTRAQRPGVDLIDHPVLASMLERYEALGRRLWVLDLTTDLEIPVVAAVSVPSDGSVRDAIMGFGAHFDPVTAVARAVTEVNQFLPRAIRAGPRPRSMWLFDEARISGEFLFPDDQAPVRRPGDFALRRHAHLREAVLDCDRIAAGARLEAYVLDQSRPDVGLSVIKVIVPGLRPMWARFAPGRLYDAPVRLGWREAPCAERDLNPAHLFL